MKTTLKTAKFTFKTAFARCVAANAVVVSCIFVANAAVCIVDFGCWLCGCGVLAIWFLYDCVANGAFGNL